MQAVNQLQGFTDQHRVDLVKEYIINTRFAGELNKQIHAATVSEIKYLLATLDVSGQTDEEIQGKLSLFFAGFNYEGVKRPIEDAYTNAKTNNDYKKVLELYNRKSLKDSIGHHLGLTDQDYSDYVLRQLNGANADVIKRALAPYLPTEIPH